MKAGKKIESVINKSEVLYGSILILHEFLEEQDNYDSDISLDVSEAGAMMQQVVEKLQDALKKHNGTF